MRRKHGGVSHLLGIHRLTAYDIPQKATWLRAQATKSFAEGKYLAQQESVSSLLVVSDVVVVAGGVAEGVSLRRQSRTARERMGGCLPGEMRRKAQAEES